MLVVSRVVRLTMLQLTSRSSSCSPSSASRSCPTLSSSEACMKFASVPPRHTLGRSLSCPISPWRSPGLVSQRVLPPSLALISSTRWNSLLLLLVLSHRLLPERRLDRCHRIAGCYYVARESRPCYVGADSPDRRQLMVQFFWFTATFAIAIIAGMDSAETAGNVANLMFSLCLIFCGYVQHL